MVRKSVPNSSRWVAKQCRSEWGVIGLDNAATLMRLLARMLYRRLADMPADLIAREEPLLGPGYWPPVTQDLQQLWRKHDSEKTDLRTQVLGITADGEQGLRRGLEQNAIYLSLVLIGDCGNLFRYGEDHVEVLRVQQLGLAIFEPLSAGKEWHFGQWRSPHEL